jgi:hypothetical protein
MARRVILAAVFAGCTLSLSQAFPFSVRGESKVNPFPASGLQRTGVTIYGAP